MSQKFLVASNRNVIYANSYQKVEFTNHEEAHFLIKKYDQLQKECMGI